MLTDPAAMRQAAAMRRMMGGGGAAAGGFPAPGVTDTTPGANATPASGQPGSTTGAMGNMFGVGGFPTLGIRGMPLPSNTEGAVELYELEMLTTSLSS